jgi:hypothetical protein
MRDFEWFTERELIGWAIVRELRRFSEIVGERYFLRIFSSDGELFD